MTEKDPRTVNFPPPNIPKEAYFTPYAETIINAPPYRVAQVLKDTATWKDWNSFVPTVEVTSHGATHDPQHPTHLVPGTALTFHCHNPDYNNKEQVSAMDIPEVMNTPDYVPNPEGPDQVMSLRWKSASFPNWMLRCERVNELRGVMEKGKDGKECVVTAYRTWEGFCGATAPVVKFKMAGLLQTRFEDWTNELKKYAEEKYGYDKEEAPKEGEQVETS